MNFKRTKNFPVGIRNHLERINRTTFSAYEMRKGIMKFIKGRKKLMKKIYMDHAATTPIHSKVLEEMHFFLKETFGNPSSIHSFGRESRAFIGQARHYIAQTIHAKENEIIFTSGGTEADNLALLGIAEAYQERGKHIIVSQQEHQAILDAAKQLEKEGFSITYVPVYENGQVSVQDIAEALTDETILVSLMYANNETGIKQPIVEVAKLLKDHQAFFHTDAVQAYGQVDIDSEDLPLDLLTGSAHKMNGPKGIGFLYVAEGIHLGARQFGGEQERKRRPGTENSAGIIGFHKAAQIAFENMRENNERNKRNKQAFLQTLQALDVPFAINGAEEEALSSIVNISFPGTHVEQMLTNLDLSGIAASSGSACTAGTVEPSHVMRAMFGKEDSRTTNSIRFSFGWGQTEEEMVEAAKRIQTIVTRLTK